MEYLKEAQKIINQLEMPETLNELGGHSVSMEQDGIILNTHINKANTAVLFEIKDKSIYDKSQNLADIIIPPENMAQILPHVLSRYFNEPERTLSLSKTGPEVYGYDSVKRTISLEDILQSDIFAKENNDMGKEEVFALMENKIREPEDILTELETVKDETFSEGSKTQSSCISIRDKLIEALTRQDSPQEIIDMVETWGSDNVRHLEQKNQELEQRLDAIENTSLVKSLVNEIKEAAQKAIDETRTTVKTMFENMKNTVIETKDVSIASIKDTYAKAYDAKVDREKTLHATETSQKFARREAENYGKDAARDIRDEAISSQVKHIEEKIADRQKEFDEAKGIDKFFKGISKFYNDHADKAAISSIKNLAGESLVMDKILDGTEGVRQAIKDAPQKVAEVGKEAFQKGEKMGEDFIKAISDTTAKVHNTFLGAKNHIGKMMENAGVSMAKATYDLATTIANHSHDYVKAHDKEDVKDTVDKEDGVMKE